MPKGKMPSSGAVFWSIKLPDCSCEQWLFENRKQSQPQLTDLEKDNCRKAINDALCIYIQRQKIPIPTWTEFQTEVNKARVAAKRFVNALSSQKNKSIALWRGKLAHAVSIDTLGQQTHRIFCDLLRKEGFKLSDCELGLKNANLTKTCLDTINGIACLKLEKPVFGGFSDPALFAYVSALMPIWKQLTGRTALPTLVSKNCSQRKYLFGEWLQETLHRANQHLAAINANSREISKGQLSIPLEGSVLDIVTFLEKETENEKSGGYR